MAEETRIEQLDRALDALLARHDSRPPAADAELAALLALAADLCDLPREKFKQQLKSDLERKAAMTTTIAKPIREGFRTVTPRITVAEGARLIEFLQRTFGAEEVLRVPSPIGFHAEIRIGNSMLMIGSGESVRGQERVGAFHVYVPDCDAAFRRAVEAGATSMGEPADRPYGERSGFAKDFAGNLWFIATRFGSQFAPEGLGTVVPFVFPSKARAFIDFVKRAFAAEEMGVYEESGRVVHGAVRIGDAVVEMGEPQGEAPSLSSSFVLHVEDCEEWYRRALAAGASSLEEPADKPFGRLAAVADAFGNLWYFSAPTRDAAG